MSLEGVLHAILAGTPVPGLSAAHEILKLIVSTVGKLKDGKKDLEALATDIALLLRALDRRLQASSPSYSAWAEQELRHLTSVLNEILLSLVDEQSRSFIKTLLRPEVRMIRVKRFRQRINTAVQAFQISTSTDGHEHFESLEARLKKLELSQTQIRDTSTVTHPSLQSAADLAGSDAIDAQDAFGSDPASPASDIVTSCVSQFRPHPLAPAPPLMSTGSVFPEILENTPDPGLSAAFDILQLIASTVGKLSDGKKQLETLSKAVARLLMTLDRKLKASSLRYATQAEEELQDLNSLLKDILEFVLEEQSRSFIQSFLRPEMRTSQMNQFYRRIESIDQALQISTLANVQSMQSMLLDDLRAHSEDVQALEARVKSLEYDQTRLRRTSGVADPNLQSAADMVRQDALNAQDASGSNPASPACDISFEDQRSRTGSMVSPLAPDVTHRIRLVPLEAPSFMQPVVYELEEGLRCPLWVGCPRDEEPYPFVAYRERIERCHAELYAIPGPRFFLRDPTGRCIRLNGRSLSAADGPSDLHPIKDGDIVQLNIGYSDRLGITHPSTRLKIETLPRLHNNSTRSARSGSNSARLGIPEASNATNGSMLVQFADVFDPPSFTAVLCELIDGARPVRLRRSPAGNTSSAIAFDSRTVSRRHAALWSEQGQVFIIDTHSAHGTYLNGTKLVQGRTLANAEMLIDGDILRIGAMDERAAIRGITAKLRVLRIAR